MEVLQNQTKVRYPLIKMCDNNALQTTLDLGVSNESYILMSPNYPRPYPRGSGSGFGQGRGRGSVEYCSLNVTIGRNMQLHLSLVDLDLVSSGLWPPSWQQRFLAYLELNSNWSAQEQPTVESGTPPEQTQYEIISGDRNCSGEPDVLRMTSSSSYVLLEPKQNSTLNISFSSVALLLNLTSRTQRLKQPTRQEVLRL